MLFSFFENLVSAFPKRAPAQPPKSLYKFCRHYSRGMEKPLLIMTGLSTIIAIVEVSLFGFMGQLVDWLGSHSRETFLQDEWPTLLGMSFITLIALPVLIVVQSLVIHQTLLGNFPMAVRWLAHRYLIGQSLSFFQDEFAGRIATKVMQTALSVRETVIKLMDILVFIVVYFITILVLLGSADWRLILPLIVWAGLYVATLRILIPKLKRTAERQANARSLMTGRIVDTYTNITTVKLFSHGQRESQYAQEGMNEFLQTVHPQMRLATWLYGAIWTLNAFLVFSTAAVSIFLWLHELVSIGAIAIAVSLALRLNGMAQWLMWEISALFENIGTVHDGMSTLSQKVEVVDVANASELTAHEGRIEFKDIRFRFEPERSLFDNLNLSIKPGEKIGLVGRSGAGKSTLINLLLRFHDLKEGSIRIDGQDISQVSQESLRANIGVVTQDTSLLHRSVRENIVYGRPNASEQEMIAATEKAEAMDFIKTLSDPSGRNGFDAHVGERGVKLSGGQRQRIAIARVMLKDAPILILDEATSALDSEVEAAIQKSLYRLMEGKTVIAIAHRLSTIAAMDRLLVLDEGRIVESGSHSELVAKNGIYATLWAHQSGGFIGTD